MLELTYGNRTEALLRILTDRVQAERAAGKGPWEPIHIVAPNPCFKEYLRQGLARTLGVAANIQFSYLDGLWKDLLAEGSGQLLAYDLLRAGLLALLGDRALLAGDDLKPVRDYLGTDTGQLKRVQLASELARLFEEYQMSRPDWIDLWRKGELGGAPDPPMEAWQARLWRETVRLLDGAPAEGQVRHCTLLELAHPSRFKGLPFPRAIHAFGLTHVAQAYQEVFQAFAPLPATTLHLYALNPCGEFWEDLETGRNQNWARRQEAQAGPWDGLDEDPYRLVADGPLALRLWGRPGREKIRLLNEVSQCDFTPAFELPDDATLLGQLQRDILFYRDPEGAGTAAPDDSVRCLACPSPRREAEVVASEIWRLLELHAGTPTPLSFSEIAVVVPPGAQEAYLAHLQAAFHDAHQIPMVQVAEAFPVMAQTLEAVELLLDLPASGLTRAALLRVLQHPGLGRRFGDLETGAWGRWCEEFGIIRGGDRGDWQDTYLDQDALNWDQGLKRIVLGKFMTEGLDLQLGDSSYRVNGARDEVPAAAFIAQVRGLCGDAKDLLHGRQDPRAWMRQLWNYLERWLQADEGDDAEPVIKALERISAALQQPFQRVPDQLELPAVDFAAARHLALEALQRLEEELPANLARGVVVTSYATMRAIPFRAIFLMGNGEGSFPTRNRTSALDLRSKGRRPGDVSQTEKEKYLFLEMLLSARDHLVVSYVALDELSGESFEPSGLYKEFRMLLGAYLAPAWAPGKSGDPFLESHPLRRFAGEYFRPWFAGPGALRTCSEIAEKEARALWLGTQARSQGIVMPLTLGELTLPPPASGQLRAALDSPAVPEAVSARETLRLSLGDLKTFLECPLSGAAAARLGLRNRDLEDRTGVENEPFASEFLETWALQREVILGVLAGGQSPEAVYADSLKRLQSEGCAPFGVFSAAEQDKNLGVIRGWAGYLGGPGAAGTPATWRLGDSRSGAERITHSHPPLVFSVQGRTVELSGDLRVQLGGSLFLETGTRPGAGSRARLMKKALGAYLDHHVLACIDPNHGEHLARFVYERPMASSPEQEVTFRFPALTPEDSRRQLQAWIEDLLTGDHAVLLPIEAVIDAWNPPGLTPDSILEFVDSQVNGSKVTLFSTLYGPVPDPARFPPPADPLGIMTRRLGGYLDLVCGVEKREEA